jgi:hypothetical protein
MLSSIDIEACRSLLVHKILVDYRSLITYNMMDKAQVFEGEHLRRQGWENVQVWKWEDASTFPAFDLSFNFRRPEKIRFFWGDGSVLLNWHIHIRTATVMLGTVSTVQPKSAPSTEEMAHFEQAASVGALGRHIPLGKVLVATDVPSFAGVTAFTGLGMAM